MRHLKAGRKLKRTASHKRALMGNLATALFEHKKITTTEAKAKELRSFAEALITRAKRAVSTESKENLDVHSRRVVGRVIKSKAVLQELFDEIAPRIMERQGGYTRIIKLGERRGDAGREAIIELVDWSNPQDGAGAKKKSKKAAAKPARPTRRKKSETKAEETPVVADENVSTTSVDEQNIAPASEENIASENNTTEETNTADNNAEESGDKNGTSEENSDENKSE